ncbi:MAG: MOSC N-terminal beta barrel domain-containing protein [Burkholderiaceae bacterium]
MSGGWDVALRVESLHLYPIKSCAGVSPAQALTIETGLELDRAWMVVDEHAEFVTQRELPRMALIQPSLRHADMVLRAPGMLKLHVSLDSVEQAARVRVWDDEVAAFDMGDLAAHWFSQFLGQGLRLVRFNPEQRRLSNPRWTGALEAENAFSDGFPLLVISTASLAEVNRRLAAQGQGPITMARFRPNLVLDGLDAHGEDHLDEIVLEGVDGRVRLKLVKPCTRCTIPDVDPATGAVGHAVNDVLAAYRADARLDGALTFGMNAVIVEGIERRLNAGAPGQATFRFDEPRPATASPLTSPRKPAS